MTRSALKITRSPERQELASAIGHAEKVEIEVGRITALVDAAETAAADADDRLKAARAAVVDARSAQVATYEAAIEQGHPAPRDDAVQDALHRETGAQEHLAAMHAALSSLQDKLDDAKIGAEKAREVVTAGVRSVLDEAMETFLEETEQLQDELVQRRMILRYVNQAALPKWPSPADQGNIRDRVRDFTNVDVPRSDYSSRYTDTSYPEILQWRDAIAALQRDADAALPQIGALS